MPENISKRIAFGAAASWLSRGTAIAIGLLLQPVLFRKLPNEELGIWLLLGQTWAVLGVLDLGFGAVITRRIALTIGRGEAGAGDLADLLESGERVFRGLGVLALAGTCVAGYWYLKTLPIQESSFSIAWVAWFILCFSQAMNLWSSIWTALLQGIGFVGWDSLIASAVQVTVVAVQIAAVTNGGGLLHLAGVAAAGAIVQRLITQWMAKRSQPALFAVGGTWRPSLLRGVPSEAFRAWLTSMGTVLAFNSDSFFIASYSGAKEIPNYRASYLVVLTLNMLSAAFVNSSSVFVSHLWSSNRLPLIHTIVVRNLRLSLLIMFSGAAVLFAAGPEVFRVWLGPGRFAGYGLLAIFFVTLTLEAHSLAISTAARATGFEVFASSSVLGGLGKIGLSWLLVSHYGLTGIAVATLAAQVLAFHWYVYWKGLGRLGLLMRSHIWKVAVPCVATGAGMYFLNLAMMQLLSAGTDLARVVVCGVTTGLCAAGSVWLWVLSQQERQYLVSKVSGTGREAAPAE